MATTHQSRSKWSNQFGQSSDGASPCPKTNTTNLLSIVYDLNTLISSHTPSNQIKPVVKSFLQVIEEIHAYKGMVFL